jgi:hypothetical protein
MELVSNAAPTSLVSLFAIVREPSFTKVFKQVTLLKPLSLLERRLGRTGVE